MPDVARIETSAPDTRNGTPNRGVVVPRFGDAGVLSLDHIPYPRVEGDDVVVRVRAASVNPVDWKIRNGDFPPVQRKNLPVVLGRDLAGTVADRGPSVSDDVATGDRIFAHIGFDRGAQADYVIVKSSELSTMPTTLDFAEAGAVPLAAMTAWQGLFDHGGMTAGQRVLVHGGAGGVGMFAIQLAKAKGATVLTTAGADDLDFVRALGADTAIDYRNGKFEDVATDIDLVLDLIGGETRDRSWGVLKRGGILVSTLDQPDREKAAAHGVRAAERWLAEPDAAQLGEIAALIDMGKVVVEIGETYSLTDVATAYDRQENGHVRGKIVLMMT
ncbi:MAG: NADP-dependent oxidoreductase [Sphingomonas bacterium]|nr:NADP-dependent oxidoreductase [Sphingomonas bacterium]